MALLQTAQKQFVFTARQLYICKFQGRGVRVPRYRVRGNYDNGMGLPIFECKHMSGFVAVPGKISLYAQMIPTQQMAAFWEQKCTSIHGILGIIRNLSLYVFTTLMSHLISPAY